MTIDVMIKHLQPTYNRGLIVKKPAYDTERKIAPGESLTISISEGDDLVVVEDRETKYATEETEQGVQNSDAGVNLVSAIIAAEVVTDALYAADQELSGVSSNTYSPQSDCLSVSSSDSSGSCDTGSCDSGGCGGDSN